MLTRLSRLRRLLSKPVPERYSISASSDDQKHYDWISVHGATKLHPYVMLRNLSSDGDTVSYLWWDSEESNERAKSGNCSISDIDWDSLKASHRFRTWEIEYESLLSAYFHDLLRLQRARWLIQRFRNRFIRNLHPNYQIKLLQILLAMHQENKPIRIWDLLVRVYGGAIRLCDEQYTYFKQLEFLVDSLVESGNAQRKTKENALEFIGLGDVVPLPRAISTLASYEWEKTKLATTVLMARCQLLLGIGMLSMAAATVYLKFFQ